ncbi:MAG: hypothetical protein HGA85_00055 [Nanoarchaeota archaeon]|nr:hypothetical protein [Nanoarchaeota archaeon]
MHDTIIGLKILEDIKKHGKVKSAILVVGELAGIEADHLLEHLAEVSKIKFSAEEQVSKVKCKCGYEGRAKIAERMHDFVLFECPKCGEVPTVIEGDKIILKSVSS